MKKRKIWDDQDPILQEYSPEHRERLYQLSVLLDTQLELQLTPEEKKVIKLKRKGESFSRISFSQDISRSKAKRLYDSGEKKLNKQMMIKNKIKDLK